MSGIDNIGSYSCMDNVMEINYASDELGSNDPNNLDHEKEQRYDKFIVEELGNNYKIKVGLKFLSLDEFTEEIIEWSVLNGRDKFCKK